MLLNPLNHQFKGWFGSRGPNHRKGQSILENVVTVTLDWAEELKYTNAGRDQL